LKKTYRKRGKMRKKSPKMGLRKTLGWNQEILARILKKKNSQ